MWTWVDSTMVAIVLLLFIGVCLLKRHTEKQHVIAEKELDEAINKYAEANPEIAKTDMFKLLTQTNRLRYK